MITRSHGLVLSLLLGTASAVGAYAMISTAKLGNAETKPEVMSSRLIAKRAHKLDSWEASLRKALKSRPPALAPLNRYAAVMFVTGPDAAALPATVAPEAKAQPAKPPARQVAEVQPKPAVVVATAARPAAKPKVAAPVAVAEPEHEDLAPAPLVVAAPAPAPANAATAPAPQEEQKKQDDEHEASAPSSTPATTLSVEQQCRQLLRAAEGKGEQAKKDAEKQCEALKQAAEKKG